MRSADDRNGTDLRETIVNDKFTVRPGMAGVRKLPDGTYVMGNEVCNYDPVHICTIWTRTSQDGWDFGDPSDLSRGWRETPSPVQLTYNQGSVFRNTSQCPAAIWNIQICDTA
ncbi:hypothetical protein [Saccharopolyspora sp. NPDC002376]